MPPYKYCIVPKCNSTTAVTPNKLFFQVPRNAEIRSKWSEVMKRNNKPPLSNKSALHCCEDHFDVETDMENYTKFQMMGGSRRLKKGVLPHKFACQKKEEVTIIITKKIYKPKKNLLELSAYQKRKQVESFKRALNSNISQENLVEVPIEFVKCEPDILTDTTEGDPTEDDNTPENESNGPPSHRSIGIQVNLKKTVRSKATNIDNSPPKRKIKREK